MFNDNIDELSYRVGVIWTQIVDTGTAHPTRTDAKEVIGDFSHKLSHALRTKRKRKAMTFGDSIIDSHLESAQQKFKAYLNVKKEPIAQDP